MLGDHFSTYTTLKGIGASVYIAAANVALSLSCDEAFAEQFTFDVENGIIPCETAWHGADNGFGPDSVDRAWGGEHGCIQYAADPTRFIHKYPYYNHLGFGINIVMCFTDSPNFNSTEVVKHFNNYTLASITKDNARTYAAMFFDRVFDSLGKAFAA